MLHRAQRRTATTNTVRETEAEAVAFVAGKTIGPQTSRASANHIQLYHADAALMGETQSSVSQLHGSAARILITLGI
jgi:hypothetical protein